MCFCYLCLSSKTYFYREILIFFSKWPLSCFGKSLYMTLIGLSVEKSQNEACFLSSLSNTRDLFLELLPQSDHLTVFMDRKQEQMI